MTQAAEKLIEIYESLTELQKLKESILVERKIDELGVVDEKIVTCYNRALEISKDRESLKPSAEEVKKINNLYLEITELEKGNQTLIEYSLDLINKIFTGIMKMATVKTKEYDNTGKSNTTTDDYNLSSISKEA